MSTTCVDELVVAVLVRVAAGQCDGERRRTFLAVSEIDAGHHGRVHVAYPQCRLRAEGLSHMDPGDNPIPCARTEHSDLVNPNQTQWPIARRSRSSHITSHIMSHITSHHVSHH
eukprot:6462072-Pyramimonas_sp.AAC.1